MYKTFFGLKREPFSVAADPRFIYMSPDHRMAAQHMLFGLQSGAGFILLTGDVGAGKSMVCRAFLRMLPPTADVANVVNPRLDFRGLLLRICEELRIDVPTDSVDPIDAIHGHLLLAHAQGRRTLIVVDEAQALSHEVLELLRLLTNLDSTGSKLQIFLIGQPELRETLRLPALEPVSQRIVARFHLRPLPEPETARYIAHRLKVAGLEGPLPFDDEAMLAIHNATGGLPRRINVLCDRALATARTLGTRHVNAEFIQRITPVVFDERPVAAPATHAAPHPAVPEDTPATQTPAVTPPSARFKLPLSGMALVAMIVSAVIIGAGLRTLLMDSPAAPPQPAPAVSTSPVAPAPAAAPVQSAPVHEASASAPAPPPPSSSSLSYIQTTAFDESTAWRQLAQLWDETLPPGEPCAAAMQRRLYCHRAAAGIENIRQLGRPGILRLKNPDGSPSFVLLVELGGNTVLLRTSDGEHRVALDTLAGRWQGDFATLWRGPAQYRSGTPGDNAELATWLHQRFAVLYPDAPAQPTGAKELHGQIAQFQLANGLRPDGIPGPITLMKLNRLSGVMEPVLKIEH